MFFNLTADQESVLQKYINNIGDNKEFEIRFGKFIYNRETKRSNFDSNVEMDFFYTLKKSLISQNLQNEYIVTTEYIYEQEGIKGNIKKIKNIDGSEQFIIKNSLMKYDIYDYEMRFALASEKIITKNYLQNFDEKNYKITRNKKRHSFIFTFGKLDMTIVEESYKDQSKPTLKYEIELEIFKKDYNGIMSMITLILQTRQNNFFVINNPEKRNVLNQYKNLVNNYNFVGAQPETLHKNQLSNLYKELYSVTDKADGDRAFMFIDNNKQIYFIDNNMNKVFKTNVISHGYNNTLIDGELIHHNNKIYFMAFDLLAYNGNDIRGNNSYLLKQRLDRLNHIISSVKSNELYDISMKKFFYNNVFIGSEVILKSINDKFYKNDGLIFTPMNEPYPLTKKWSNLLKWKPAELNTIDLYSINIGNNTWELYVQHVDKTDQKINKPVLALFDVNKLCYVPEKTTDGVTFRTIFGNEIIDPTTDESFKSNTVIEYKWDKENSKFVPLRTRWDKTSNPRKHGNFSAVACDIWNNIHNPIEKELLFKFTTYNNSKDFFFERMRKFHNKVKEYLYNKYCNKTQNLLELCSGRGGDLQKWLYNNIENVEGYDISDKNINECQKRLKQVAPHKLNNYNFTQLDLSTENAKNMIIDKYQQQKFETICCQFAVHYFFENKNTLENIINIIDNCLLDNGYFIITFMDNKQIDSLFKNTQNSDNICYSEYDNEIIYYLSKEDNNNNFYGNKIRILLNGNNILGEGSNEFIIDFDKFSEMMISKGYVIQETDLFKNLYETSISKSIENLQDIEKNISFLNRYCVFRKSNTKNENDQSDFAIPKTITKSNLNETTKNKYFVQQTIDLHKNNFSLYMLNTTYDLIDLLNCIEYKYYKNIIQDKYLESFTDIISIFEDLNISYKPIYVDNVYNILEQSQPIGTEFNVGNPIYFTYHKHTVDKKMGDEIEVIEYNNWYVIMHKSNLLFDTSKIQNNEIQQVKISSNTENEQVKISSNTENEQVKMVEDNVNISKNSEYQMVLQEINSNITVKKLKMYLSEYNLKISGKKEELISRLMEHIKL